MFVGSLALATLSLAAPPGDAVLEARIDAVLARFDRSDAPGCAVGVYRRGELLYARGHGMADLEQGIALDAHSVFRIGSTSKQFTASVIVLLSLDDVLSLDDDVRTWVPELPEYDSPITIRHLLHHTSGIRDYLTLMWLAGHDEDASYYTADEVLAMLARQRALNFEPGTEHLYSNSGYFLLSVVCERATGKSLREVARERIFEPLGMRDTHFHDDYAELVPHRAEGYAPREGGGWRISRTSLELVGDGGVFTTVEDLARWDRNFYEPIVGGPAFLEVLLGRGRLSNGRVLDYACGLVHGTYRGLATVSHGGAFVGYRADLLRFPEAGVSVAVLANRANADPSALARRVADVVLERISEREPDLARSLAPRPREERRRASAREEAPAEEEEAKEAESEEAAPADRREESPGPRPAADADRSSAKPPPPPPDPLPAALRAAFAGEWYSPELDAVWTLAVDGEGLRVRGGHGTDVPLFRAGERALRVGVLRLVLVGPLEAPEALVLDAGRVRGLRFEPR